MKKEEEILMPKYKIEYHLSYQEDRNSLYSYRYFKLKKDLNKYIRKLPKFLIHFEVRKEKWYIEKYYSTLISMTNLTNDYLIQEIHYYHLK